MSTNYVVTNLLGDKNRCRFRIEGKHYYATLLPPAIVTDGQVKSPQLPSYLELEKNPARAVNNFQDETRQDSKQGDCDVESICYMYKKCIQTHNEIQ